MSVKGKQPSNLEAAQRLIISYLQDKNLENAINYLSGFHKKRVNNILLELNKSNQELFEKLLNEAAVTKLLDMDGIDYQIMLNQWLEENKHADNEPIRPDQVDDFVSDSQKDYNLNAIDLYLIRKFAIKESTKQEDKIKDIMQKIQINFRTFGGGRSSNTNIIAAALANEPLAFAAGVDVREVIQFVISELNDKD